MHNQPTQDMKGFFERYGRDFDNRDWMAFTALLHEPFFTVRGDGSVHFLPSRDAARTFFENVSNVWRQEGYERCVTNNYEMMVLGRYSQLATFDWELLRKDETVIRKWRQSYQLIFIQQEWKVLGSTFHGT
jgi:hypothetical protein